MLVKHLNSPTCVSSAQSSATFLEHICTTMKQMKIEVIINASSGTDDKKDVQRRLHELFVASGHEARISLALTGAGVVDLAQQAARSDTEIIIAGGGDGTINSVAYAVIQSGK